MSNDKDVVIDAEVVEETTSPEPRSANLNGTEIVKQSTYFKPWHRMIARKFVLRGMRPSQIAEEMKLTPSYISVLLNHNPMMKVEIARLEKLLEDKIIEAEVEDFVKDEFVGMLPTALEIIRESIGDIGLQLQGKSDRKEQRSDAWAIIDRVSPKLAGGDTAVNFNLQLQQVIQDNRGKSAAEVITNLTSQIREKKALQRGK